MVELYMPNTLEDAVALLAENDLTPYGGGTDLMVENRENVQYLFLRNIPELCRICEEESFVRIGAATTFTEALASPLVPDLMKEAVSRIGSPAIRSTGTFGGNLANGSDKADSVLILFAMDAKIRLVSSEGERILEISQFHRGRKNLDLRRNELIADILLPKQGNETYCYTKVGGRNSLAITYVSFAGIFAAEEDRIIKTSICFGAAGDAIQRYKDIERILIGKTLAEAKQAGDEIIAAYERRLRTNESRVGSVYQRYVCRKLLEEFLQKNGIRDGDRT